MNIVVTRPEQDAADLRERIEGMGHDVLFAPLLTIEPVPIEASAIADAAALIVTSRNAVRAVSASSARDTAQKTLLFAVGPATAAAAREHGFTNVIVGPGTAAALVDTIAERVSAEVGPLTHLAGDHLAFDLASALEARGFEVRTVLAYRSLAAAALPSDVTAALAGGNVDAVILMSPLTARTWAKLASSQSDEIDLTKINHICLSQKVADALPEDVSRSALTAPAPRIDQIFALLYRLARNTKNR